MFRQQIAAKDSKAVQNQSRLLRGITFIANQVFRAGSIVDAAYRPPPV
jgi:hypothetical protein